MDALSLLDLSIARRIFEVFAVTFFFTRLICYGYVVYLLGLKLLLVGHDMQKIRSNCPYLKDAFRSQRR